MPLQVVAGEAAADLVGEVAAAAPALGDEVVNGHPLWVDGIEAIETVAALDNPKNLSHTDLSTIGCSRPMPQLIPPPLPHRVPSRSDDAHSRHSLCRSTSDNSTHLLRK